MAIVIHRELEMFFIFGWLSKLWYGKDNVERYEQNRNRTRPPSPAPRPRSRRRIVRRK